MSSCRPDEIKVVRLFRSHSRSFSGGTGGGVRCAHRPLASVLQIPNKHPAEQGYFSGSICLKNRVGVRVSARKMSEIFRSRSYSRSFSGGAGGGVRYAHRPLASVLQIKNKHHASHGFFIFTSPF